MAMQPAAQPDPSAQPQPGADSGDDTSGGYTIEIKVSAQGAISVCVEPQAEEDAEEAGGGGSGDAGGGEDDDSQPVASIREACKLVTQIYQSQGQLPDTSADQADMAAGYGKD